VSVYAKLGLSLLAVCALVAIANAWAFRAYPDQWGGPNIGGGLIQLLAYAGILAGAGFLVAAWVNRRRSRSRQ
jgi:hypothetical protein